jgi:hypothetical protein
MALALVTSNVAALAQSPQEIFRSSKCVLFDIGCGEEAAAPAQTAQSAKPRKPQATRPQNTVAPSELAASSRVREERTEASMPAKPANAVAGANGKLAMRYRVEKDFGGGDWRAVDPDTVFLSGDRIRLAVEANANAFLYVVSEGSSGRGQLIYPYRNASETSYAVEPFKTYIVPNPKEGYFRFDDQAGNEKLFVVLSRSREASLDRFLPNVRDEEAPAPSKPKNDDREWRLARSDQGVEPAVLSQLRTDIGASRDLVMERVEEPLDDQTGAVAQTISYIASQDTSEDARVIVEVTLSHR